MKKYVNFLLIAILLCVCSGCVNLIEHVYEASITTVYEPTTIVWKDGICCWSNENMRKDPVGCSIIRLTYPFWLIDFPCEVVFDTLTLPYDLYQKYNYPHNRSINEKTIYKIAPKVFEE